MCERMVCNFFLLVTGNPVGFSSFPLKQVAENIPDSLSPSAYFNKLSWMDLFSAQSMVIFSSHALIAFVPVLYHLSFYMYVSEQRHR